MSPANKKIRRRRQVKDKAAIKRSLLYQLVRTQQFPEPIQLGPKSVGWLEHEIDAWIESRMQARVTTGGRHE